jgi:magnesium chelatase subunit I
MNAKTYVRHIREIPELSKAIKKMTDAEVPETLASIMEFILEGLHLNKRLNKTKIEGKTVYRN